MSASELTPSSELVQAGAQAFDLRAPTKPSPASQAYGLPPPNGVIVNLAPAKATSGTRVLVQGQHFVGTTGVWFNGVKAEFEVLAAGYIGAVVPPGATSGRISGTNGGGTTESVWSFTVE